MQSTEPSDDFLLTVKRKYCTVTCRRAPDLLWILRVSLHLYVKCLCVGGGGWGGGAEAGKIADCCVGDMGLTLEGPRRHRGVCVDI